MLVLPIPPQRVNEVLPPLQTLREGSGASISLSPAKAVPETRTTEKASTARRVLVTCFLRCRRLVSEADAGGKPDCRRRLVSDDLVVGRVARVHLGVVALAVGPQLVPVRGSLAVQRSEDVELDLGDR